MSNLTEKNYQGVLVIGEYSGSKIHPVTYELLGKGLELARRLETKLECVIVAPADVSAEKLCHCGADKVIHIAGDCFRVPEENLLRDNLLPFIRNHKPEIILIGATELGRSLAPRLACALETGLTADCTDLLISDAGDFIQVRPAFSDNILAHIKTVTYPKISTVRYKEFKEAEEDYSRPVITEIIKPYILSCSTCAVEEVFPAGEMELSDAQIIVAAGRGIRAKDDMAMVYSFADSLGAQVGVSRALVDAGIADSQIQVGYSGHRVKPEIYIACGISGAPQHLAGMKESGTIIAINKDPSAPIFRIADYGIVGDLYHILPELTEHIKRFRKEEK